ncbi:50S ribosomal protein L11 methyltransferase [Desulfonatronum thioautotrophicum]|uniref:50S ribosomal protein L11 methyltransferase n=1 Tax=Desulfonatronum thioautotrophicum TaxID=617001 RepID=UPI0005EB9D76|nr:50S ribosomal protein L11 methyltransferase [Desulfonatronum thioautotrophicum]
MKLLRVELIVAVEAEDVFAGFLAQRVSWGWEMEPRDPTRTRFVIYFEKDADAQNLVQEVGKAWPNVRCNTSTFEDRDWSQSWRDFFVPVRIEDTFMVLPPWLDRETDTAGLIPLYIEPKMAFGSGHHATTALCLRAVAMLWRKQAVSRQTGFLDLGTGSGILALACSKLGMSGTALDIDPVAVSNAQENFALNGVANKVVVQKGGLESFTPNQQVGLLLANILAGPLVRMAPALVRRLESGGSLVLSGILRDQAERVTNAYRDQGLSLPQELVEGEWVALIWD